MGAIRRVTLISVVTAGALACSMAAPGVAGAAATGSAPRMVQPSIASSYRVITLDDPHNSTYNILSGINREDRIVGFYGRGDDPGHPSKGFLARLRFGKWHFTPENFPHSAQTQVSSISNNGYIVGTFSYTNRRRGNVWYGFWAHDGHFHKVTYPGHRLGQNQLTGINDHGFATGSYIDTRGRYHPFRYDIHNHTFSVPVSGGKSVTASNINDKGAIVGFFRNARGPWISYLTSKGHAIKFTVPVSGARHTDAQGINDYGTIVGLYTWGGKVYGFVRSPHGRFHRWHLTGATGLAFDSINNVGDIVGWYSYKGHIYGVVLVPR